MPVSLGSADRFVGFAISIATMQLSKSAFMSDPRTTTALRIAFSLSMLLQLAAAAYMRRCILAKNDKTVLRHKPEASLFNTGDAEEVETTVCDYDMAENNKMVKTILIQSVVLFIVHAKWHVTQPLFIQSFGFVRQLLFSPLYRTHIYGMKIARPFEENMLFEAQTQDSSPVVEVEPEMTPAEKRKKKED